MRLNALFNWFLGSFGNPAPRRSSTGSVGRDSIRSVGR